MNVGARSCGYSVQILQTKSPFPQVPTFHYKSNGAPCPLPLFPVSKLLNNPKEKSHLPAPFVSKISCRSNSLHLQEIMKKSGLVAASMAAASATAYSVSSSSSSKSNIPHEDVNVSSKKREKNSASQTSTSSDKFAPRFDGLRFIETLVTAHR